MSVSNLLSLQGECQHGHFDELHVRHGVLTIKMPTDV